MLKVINKRGKKKKETTNDNIKNDPGNKERKSSNIFLLIPFIQRSYIYIIFLDTRGQNPKRNNRMHIHNTT